MNDESEVFWKLNVFLKKILSRQPALNCRVSDYLTVISGNTDYVITDSCFIYIRDKRSAKFGKMFKCKFRFKTRMYILNILTKSTFFPPKQFQIHCKYNVNMNI